MTHIQVELQETMGSDISIANAAWSSTYDKDRREDKYDDLDKVSALVKRMAREGHSTPFESVVFRFWFRWPIFVDRQHMTHRIQSASGLSGRYRTMPSDFFPLPPDVLVILKKAGVESIEVEYDGFCQAANDLYGKWVSYLKKLRDEGGESIISKTDFKRVRECVKNILPIANMVERTTMINLRSFANYQKLRNSEHAQKEIRVAAQMMLKAVQDANICPIALKALEEKGWQI